MLWQKSQQKRRPSSGEEEAIHQHEDPDFPAPADSVLGLVGGHRDLSDTAWPWCVLICVRQLRDMQAREAKTGVRMAAASSAWLVSDAAWNWLRSALVQKHWQAVGYCDFPWSDAFVKRMWEYVTKTRTNVNAPTASRRKRRDANQDVYNGPRMKAAAAWFARHSQRRPSYAAYAAELGYRAADAQPLREEAPLLPLDYADYTDDTKDIESMKAEIRVEDDGAVVVADGKGNEIRSEGGTTAVTCQGDLAIAEAHEKVVDAPQAEIRVEDTGAVVVIDGNGNEIRSEGGATYITFAEAHEAIVDEPQAEIRVEDDGAVVVTDGTGNEIRSEGGTTSATCQGDISGNANRELVSKVLQTVRATQLSDEDFMCLMSVLETIEPPMLKRICEMHRAP